MARDPAQMEQAKKEAVYDTREVRQTLLHAGKQAPTELRRNSSHPRISVGIDMVNTETLADAGDDENPVTLVHSYEAFLTHNTRENLNEQRFYGTHESLAEDLTEKVQHAAVHFAAKGDGPGFLFRSLTAAGKAAWPDFEGVMDQRAFDNRYREDPKALFQEVKLRALLMTAYANQTEQLTELAKGLDRNVKIYFDWANHFGSQTIAERDATPEDLEHRQQAMEQLIQYKNDYREKEKELAESRAEADNLAIQIARLQAIITKQVLDQQTSAGSQAVRQGTPGGDSIHSSTAGIRLSEKLPDPPIFHNDKDKDSVSFKAWFRQMKDKLELNADRFPSDRAKHSRILSRLGGDASDAVEPRTHADHPAPLVTSEALMNYLWAEYHNPNEKKDAKTAYKKLKLSPGQDYHVFKNSFIRFAAEARIPKTEWKDDFFEKLYPDFARSMALQAVDEGVSFDEFVKTGARVSLTFRNLAPDNQNSQPRRGKGRGVAASNAAASAAAGTGIAAGAKVGAAAGRAKDALSDKTDEEIKKLVEEGRCFKCNRQGHRANACPDRSSRVSEIIANIRKSHGQGGQGTTEKRVHFSENVVQDKPVDKPASNFQKIVELSDDEDSAEN